MRSNLTCSTLFTSETQEEEGERIQEEEEGPEEGAQEGPRGSRTHPRHLAGAFYKLFTKHFPTNQDGNLKFQMFLA